MPTVAEPVRSQHNVAPGHISLDAILDELREYGIPVTPLAVICRATDLGIPEDETCSMAERVRDLVALHG